MENIPETPGLINVIKVKKYTWKEKAGEGPAQTAKLIPCIAKGIAWQGWRWGRL